MKLLLLVLPILLTGCTAQLEFRDGRWGFGGGVNLAPSDFKRVLPLTQGPGERVLRAPEKPNLIVSK